MIRKFMQFETVSDVMARGTILVLFIAITAGLFIRGAYLGYFLSSPADFPVDSYMVGALAGFLISAPVVFTFFFAAKSIYGMNQQVAKIAREDFLTGLLNRRAFFAQITDQADLRGAAQARFAKQGHLIIGDADNFKRLNDTFGHPFGDKALVCISSSFSAVTMDRAIAARIGGEEFGVFLPDGQLEEAMAMAECIRKSVADAYLVHETGSVSLSISIGMASVAMGDSLADAMKRADDALYMAKQAGKNRVVVHSENRTAASLLAA